MEKLDLEMLHTVTPEEFQHHLDTLTEEARTGNVPLRIRAEDGSSDLLLFAWDDFFAHFHEIYPPEKRVKSKQPVKHFMNLNKKNTAPDVLYVACPPA